MSTVALREKRAGLIAQAQALNTKVVAESRDFNTEERSQFDKILADADAIRGDIERIEKLAQAQADLAQRSSEPIRPSADPAEIPDSVRERMEARGWDVDAISKGRRDQRSVAYREAAEGERKAQASKEYREAFRAMLGGAEMRALQVDVATSGGFMVAPVQWQAGLIQGIDNETFLRDKGTVLTVNGAQSLGVASLDADPADADWTTELATGNADSTMAFGQRSLHPHPLAKSIKVSETLLRMVPGVDSLVQSRLQYKFAVTLESAGMTGTGAGRPLGLFTASNDGISTSRDVSTGNSTTAITFDGLASAKGTLKSAYQRSASLCWVFHRDAQTQLLKIQNGNGDYMWRESVRAGEPATLYGVPVMLSEYAPNTFTTGLYVGLIGDLSYYWWADAMGMAVKRLNELYAATNQVGFIGRLESDGMPVLEEAFVRVKLA